MDLLNALRRRSLGTKLTVANILLTALLFGTFVFALSRSLSASVAEQARNEVTEKTQLLVHLIQASDKDLRDRTEALARGFQAQLAGRFELKSDEVTIKDKATPVLALNGHPLNLDFAAVDPFTEKTGAVATVFAKTGDDFVRITTSLKNEKGERAVGTLLDREHPGYKAVIAGKSYVGVATLFGRQYMTRYDPIVDASGQTIGLSFVGLDFTEFMNTLKSTIRSLKIGKTGYFIVLDARPGKTYGRLVVHPKLEGKDLIETKDPSGRLFIREMLETGDGVISYPWTNGDEPAREKVAAYTSLKEWNWVISGGTYADEFTADVRSLRNRYAVLAIVLVAAISGFAYLLVRLLVLDPLVRVSKAAQAIATGNLGVHMKTVRLDEVGSMIQSVNTIGASLATVVSAVRLNSESVATASAEIAQGNQDLSARTESQAGALQQTASAMQQFGSTVSENVQAVRAASELAASASRVAGKSGQVMVEVVGTMKGINEASKRITDITSTIDGIAFQTNILALNAAVEAARAGDAGRGFAVVASEVRSLAARSAAAAKEIKSLIGDSVQRVETGSRLVDQAGATVNEVVASIERLSGIMTGISSASQEQATGVQQIGAAVKQMDEGTQKNSALVEEMAAAAASLQTQAVSLVQSVSAFKLA